MTQLIWVQIKGLVIKSLWKEGDKDSSSEDSSLEDALVALIHLKKQQYMKERVRIPKAPNISGYLFDLDNFCFKQGFRMSKASFHQLLDEIKLHPIFQNHSNIPQRPVKDQLMVTLKRMGTFGNGSSIGMLSRFFRISEGTVILYCSRVVEAILSLQS